MHLISKKGGAHALFFIAFMMLMPAVGQTQEAVMALMARVVPVHQAQFSVEMDTVYRGKDYFIVDGKKDKILLKGNNTVAIASALNWYLKTYGGIQRGWNGSQLALPKKLTIPHEATKVEVQPDWRVYMNYCTFNYSASWWDWERWEREIDFMAMNGINMPLSVVGLEAVWYNALLRIGYSDEEARAFLVGPAYLAWQWMTNIESANGPLPKSWIDRSAALGKKIIERELELGMQPIQQGFSGFVPRSFKTKFPTAKIGFGHDWCAYNATAQLDPLDPLFKEFGKIFLEEQDKLFGSHGYYAADPFHEGAPPQKDKPYLNAVGKAIEEVIAGVDRKGHIVMQAWSIREEIATAIAKDKLLVLDLNGSRYQEKKGFWGYDFVVGNLHNFGGRINLHGDVPLLASNQYVVAKREFPNAVGTGLFMEAIEQNPLYYDLAFEMPFRSEAIDPVVWVNNYLQRRYKSKDTQRLREIASILLRGPYRKGTNGTENSSIIAARPALNVKKSGPNAGFNIPYPPDSLAYAWKLLLLESNRLKASDGYRFDVMDIGRQVLSNLGQEMHKKAALAFAAKDSASFHVHSKRFLQLLLDVDALLSTRKDFSFDHWLSSAQQIATNQQEKDLYSYNASLLVTWWGGDKEPIIFDYSWREWSGLIKGYYYMRWKMFYDMLAVHLHDGTPYSEDGLKLVHGREALRANDFYDRLADAEEKWIKEAKTPQTIVSGKEVEVAKTLWKKYEPLLSEYYRGINPNHYKTNNFKESGF